MTVGVLFSPLGHGSVRKYELVTGMQDMFHHLRRSAQPFHVDNFWPLLTLQSSQMAIVREYPPG